MEGCDVFFVGEMSEGGKHWKLPRSDIPTECSVQALVLRLTDHGSPLRDIRSIYFQGRYSPDLYGLAQHVAGWKR